MSKKNIDKLFQEKLKDFNEIPQEHVWKAISDSLDKKKSRRIIPFWWKLGGVAAVIAVIFTLFNSLEDKNSVTPTITDTKKTEHNNVTNPTDANTIQSKNSIENQIKIVNTDATETNSVQNQEAKKEKTLPLNKQSETNRTQVATIHSKQKVKNTKAIAKTTENKVAENGIDSNNTIAKNKIDESPKTTTNKHLAKNDKNSINNTNIATTSAEDQKDKIEETATNHPKKSIFEEIEKQVDTKESLADNTTNKWSVGANIAPVYFNSFGEGSSIDPTFNSNSKSSVVNMSYGLSVAYNVSNKLSVRTGVNSVNYSYNTNKVEFSASLQGFLSSRLNNVNYSESSANVAIGNKAENLSSLANKSSDVIADSKIRNGVIAQEFGYIEVPVELDYAIIENRFGVNLIGGVSTLFLTNNTIALNGSDEIIELGEANNLNAINFSTNVGFGLNYKFTPKIRLNIEPVFKYQLGTFSETSGSFNPFSIGIYSGLNFKF